MKKILFSFILLAFASMISFAQPWMSSLPKEKVNNDNLTLYEIQQAFNDYWAPFNVDKTGHYTDSKGEYVKAGGWKQFKRWEEYWETRVDFQTGKFPNTSAYEEYQKYIKANPNTKSSAGNWVSKGPSSSTSGYHGIGRISCVGFRPGDNNTIYAGAPVGGVWKSTDGGSNWTVLGQDNASIGVSDIVVIAGASTSSDVVYIATGDDDAGDCYSIGVMKSTDGGATWNTTGLSFTASQYRKTYRLIMDPSNNSILYAATSAGVYKTTDAGSTWSNLTANYFVDLEFKPGNSTYIYGSNKYGDVYRSTNSGGSWTQVLSTADRRTELAVSANNSSIVYALITNSSSALAAVYKSTDSGASFTSIYTPGKNLLGWACDGSGTSGQGWYDLCIAADPNNANTLFVGGVNTWKSTDGGSTWNINNIWSGTCSGAATNVHADKHCLSFQNGTSTLFEGNDGGLYKTSDLGSTWSDITNGMVISQMYRIGVAQTAANDVVCGLQDNGTKNMQAATWSDVIGGDGMDCAIDFTDANTQYGEGTNGSLRRTTNHWGSSTSITSGLSGSAAWVTPFIIDLNSHNTVYVGYQDVFKSTNNGSSWTKISNWAGNTLRSLAIAPSNSNYLCAATSSTIYRTTNGGTSWSDITSGLPSLTINWILIKDNDPNVIWVALGGFNSDGVYKSTNGGSTWSNISSGLPSVPLNGIVQNKLNTSTEELYAATDVGVYYKSGTTNWQLFSANLPNVVVRELEIYYNGTNSRLFASTYGRGLWESDLYSAPAAPVADFSADDTNPVTGQTVIFTDASSNSPTSWAWSFSPATVTYVDGTSSTSQNPHITFDVSGDYSVTLTAANGIGSDDEVKNNYITAIDCTVDTYPWTEGFENGGNIPNCWSNEYVTDTQDWDYDNGGHSGNPSAAHTGSYNAILYNASSTANVTKLVSPRFDMSGLSSATLTFWHTQAKWSSDQDELRVYYKTSSGGSWSILATYTNDITTWTQETINLSSLTSDYYIAFEGTAQYGYGVCIDDVEVDGVASGPVNNTCAGAIAINEVTDLAFDTGSGATASGVNPGCGGSTDPVDLWYAYTATATATATIDLCGSAFDTRLAVYDACGGGVLACNDDACGYQSSVDISVTNGTTYYIQVGGYNANTGTGDLTIELSDQWTGATSSDWNDGTNWNSGGVPTAIVDVTLSSGATNYPVLTGNFTINDPTGTYNCKSLTIENGAQLEVYHYNDMKVYGDVKVQAGGTLLLGDDLDVQSGGNIVISGTVANNYNFGNYGDIFFRDGSTGSMTGGTLTAYDQLEFYNTTFSATGGEIHCGGTNDEITIKVQSSATNLNDFVIDANCKARLSSTSNNTLQVANFTANAGSGFTIDGGETMHIYGDATFVSDATGLSSVIQNGTLTIDGDTDYQQYLDADKWHQIAPVTTPATTGIYEDIYLYSWSEADSAYSFHSVVYDPLNLGEGYYVWNPTTPRTVHFDGSFNKTNITKSLTYTPATYTSSLSAGYNLIGNPFSSYLTHTNAWTTTNVDATIYIWNSATGNYTTMNPNIQGIDSIIPPSQSFYMKANAASASVTIPASERTHNKATAFYKSEQGQYLTIEVSDNNSQDRIMIIPNENSTYGFDSDYDAYDLRGLKDVPQLYMPIDGIEYSVNVVPQINIEDIYPVALQVGKTTQYEIKLLPSGLASQFDKILLEDLQSQTIVNLKEVNYQFVANQDDDAHRFNLRFSSPNGVDESFSSLVNVFSLNNTIIIQTSFTKGEITVYDMLGQEISSELIHSEKTEIEMNEAQSYYLVEVKNNEQVVTKKVYIK